MDDNKEAVSLGDIPLGHNISLINLNEAESVLK